MAIFSQYMYNRRIDESAVLKKVRLLCYAPSFHPSFCFFLQQFHLPNGLPACRKTGSTMARAPVFSHNTGIIGGFTNLLFRRRFTYCAMLHLFILPSVSSSISLTEGEKWYKKGVNEAIQNYTKPYKDCILSV